MSRLFILLSTFHFNNFYFKILTFDFYKLPVAGCESASTANLPPSSFYLPPSTSQLLGTPGLYFLYNTEGIFDGFTFLAGGLLMKMLGLVFFAIALNIDALMIAVSYGLRKIEIPGISLLILSGVSMAAISLSMLMGQALAQLMPQVFAHCLGGFILICLGIQVFWESDPENTIGPKLNLANLTDFDVGSRQVPLIKLPLALFKKPELVDLDHSGTILGWEALLLGLTLALDAMGAGLAVALQGYNIGLTALFVGGGQLIFTRWGLYWGAKFSAAKWGKTLSSIAGLILIVFGLAKVLHFF